MIIVHIDDSKLYDDAFDNENHPRTPSRFVECSRQDCWRHGLMLSRDKREHRSFHQYEIMKNGCSPLDHTSGNGQSFLCEQFIFIWSGRKAYWKRLSDCYLDTATVAIGEYFDLWKFLSKWNSLTVIANLFPDDHHQLCIAWWLFKRIDGQCMLCWLRHAQNSVISKAHVRGQTHLVQNPGLRISSSPA